MESLESIKHKLTSLDSLNNIVRTMKSLAAANIHQYEAATTSLRDYAEVVDLGLCVATAALPTAPLPQVATRQARHGAIIFGSDHGLCGHFNESIVAYQQEHHSSMNTGSPAQILGMGLRLKGLLSATLLPLPASVNQIGSSVEQILSAIESWQAHHEIDRVELFYHQYLPGAEHPACAKTLLPVELNDYQRRGLGAWPRRRLPVVSQPAPALLEDLIRQQLFVSLFRACAESQASEHSMRLVTMQSAEKNIGDKQDLLMQHFRHLRQEQITAELQEIVAGFGATG